MRREARLIRWAAVLAAALILVIGVVGTASAHAVLVGSDPAAGSQLAEAPTRVTLTFDQPVDTRFGRLAVIAPDGSIASTGAIVRPRDDQAAVALRPGSPRGTFVVSWRVLSADSHPVSGGFTFSVGAVTRVVAATPSGTGTAGRTVGVLLGVTRWLGYCGIILLIGPAVLYGPLWPRRLGRRPISGLTLIGAASTAAGAVGGLLLQGPYAAGSGLSGTGIRSVDEVLGTRFGVMYATRLGILLLGVVVLRALLRHPDSIRRRVVAAVLGAGLILTFPLAGHPETTRYPALTVAADAAHLAAAAIWVGGLVTLAVLALPRADAAELRTLLPVWSGWAMRSVVVLAATGTVQALVQFSSASELLNTAYGRLLAVKLGLVAIALAVASGARAWVRRAYQGRDRTRTENTAHGPNTAELSVGRLRAGVAAEAGIAAVVLAVTAVLVETAPARDANAMSAMAGPYSDVLRQGDVGLTIGLDPAMVGRDRLELSAKGVSGPLAVQEVDLAVSLPARGVEPIAVPVSLVGDRGTAVVPLPLPGTWTFRITVRTSAIDEMVFTTPITVQ